MKDKIVIAVAGVWLTSWVSYMVVNPSPDAVHWGETSEAHVQKLTLEAARRVAASATVIAAKDASRAAPAAIDAAPLVASTTTGLATRP